MTQILRHRGPDRGGIYTDEKVSLGHRRLSIIDLSEDGNQPMANEEGDLLIVYNGEIYNFKELRKQLEVKGHRFSSKTDTEVIIHGYEEWGEAVVTHLQGQFAFCIYDLNEKKLFLGRDRLGIKPLYYYGEGDQFIFASEIKAILLADIPREVNISATRNYLQLRYVPEEETLFWGIQKLLPGNCMVVKDNKISIKQFWDVPVPEIKNKGLRNSAEKVKKILTDSINKRLVADVPVGVYLSGGVDSAAITALAAQIKTEAGNDEAVKTFSVGFNYDDEVDELNKARQVAEHFQTNHHEITVQESVAELLPKLIWHLDIPHGDPVIVPQFKLSELAAQKVKVVLSGEGADELFGGYVQYKTFLQAQKTKLIPSFVKSGVARASPVKILDKFFDYPSSIGEKGKEKMIDFLSHLQDKEKAYRDLISIMSKKDKDLLFAEKIKSFDGGDKDNSYSETSGYFQSHRQPVLNQLLYYDIKRWLPNYVLFINDRMTMANSIEGRVPFLDHRLVEYSTTLPAKFKLNGGQNKIVLRKAMKNILPHPQVKKHAFLMPLDKWFKEELKDLAERLFAHGEVKKRGYFNYYYLKRIWEKYDKSKLIYGKQLFTMINFELWHRMFIDEEKIPKDNNVKLRYLL